MKSPKQLELNIKGYLESDTFKNEHVNEQSGAETATNESPEVVVAEVVSQDSTFDNLIRFIEAVSDLISTLGDLIKDPKVFTLAMTAVIANQCNVITENLNSNVVVNPVVATPTERSKSVLVNPDKNTNLFVSTSENRSSIVVNNNIYYLFSAGELARDSRVNHSSLPIYFTGERELASSTTKVLQNRFPALIDKCLPKVDNRCNPRAVLVDTANFHSDVLCSNGTTENFTGHAYACSQ